MQQFCRLLVNRWHHTSLSPRASVTEWATKGGAADQFRCSKCSARRVSESAVSVKRLPTARSSNLGSKSVSSNLAPVCSQGRGSWVPSTSASGARGFMFHACGPNADAIADGPGSSLFGASASTGAMTRSSSMHGSAEVASTCERLSAPPPPPPQSDMDCGYYVRIGGKTAVCASILLGFAAGAGMATHVSERGSREELQQTLRRVSDIVEGRLLNEEVGKLNSAATVIPIRLEDGHSRRGLLPPTGLKTGTEPMDDMRKLGEATAWVLHRHSIADAAARAMPAVVNLKVTIGMRGMSLGMFSGTGFIINSDGTILTNAHVVAEMSGQSPYQGKLLVTMYDGRTFEGEVVSFDSLSDLAVVKIKSSASLPPLPTIKLGTSQNLRPGDWVVALGSPLHLQNTVTAGIVSCVDRKSSEIGLRGGRMEFIQTDAAINQGNSGGPLINLEGEVIGINNMKAVAADGVSFAIPVDTVKKVVEQLAKHGRVIRPFIGMKMLELNEAIIGQLRERDPTFPDVEAGVLVAQVVTGSPAARAGMMSGDVIVAFDGTPVTTVRQIMDLLGDRVGEKIKIVVKRAHGKTVVLHIVTEEITNEF